MTERGAITLGMKLASLFIRGQVRCVICGEIIPDPTVCQWDHRWQLATDGPHSADNIGPVHDDPCHKIKTRADAKVRGKIRRLTGANKPRVSRKIPSRPFPPAKRIARKRM